MFQTAEMDLTLPVTELLRRFPQTVRVFNRFGIGGGGDEPAEAAARAHGVDAGALARALLLVVVDR